MTTNCFIRQIKEEVDNDNLPRINTLNITINAAGLYPIRPDGVTRAEIVGDGYFTDSTDTDNDGKEKAVVLGNTVYVHCSSSLSLYLYGMNGAKGQFGLVNSSVTSGNKNLTYDLAECLQNEESYYELRLGIVYETSLGNGTRCTGDVTDMVFNAKKLYLSGCDRIVGSMDTVIQEQASPTNLTDVGFYATNLSFNFSSLEGKNKLYIMTSNQNSNGDIKYFGDTRNRYIHGSTEASNKWYGTVENLVSRLIAQGRTAIDDYFYFYIGGSSGRWSQVTYNNKSLSEYFDEYREEHQAETSSVYMVFTWDGQGNISYNLTTTRPASNYVPLT